MTITYEKSYRLGATGPDWELMSSTNHKDSAIVNALENLAKESTKFDFNQMENILRERYKSKKEKSRCEIHTDFERIEVCTTSLIFPRFFIRKAEIPF